MTGLEKKVLEAIEKRGLTPRPYAYFLAKRSVFWTLAGLSIVFGAISAAVLIFAAQDYLTTGGRGFDEMPLDDVFAYLPFVWITILGAFLASAYFALRQTPGAYRYRTGSMLAAMLTMCAVLGGLMHAADTGRHIHGFLVRTFPFYENLTKSLDKTAPQPDVGVLTGAVLSFDGKSSLKVRDFTGQVWTVDVTVAKITLDEPLGSQEDVEINGRRTGPNTFQALSVKDWD